MATIMRVHPDTHVYNSLLPIRDLVAAGSQPHHVTLSSQDACVKKKVKEVALICHEMDKATMDY